MGERQPTQNCLTESIGSLNQHWRIVPMSGKSLMVKSWYAGTTLSQSALENLYTYLKSSRTLNNLIIVCPVPWNSQHCFLSLSVILDLNTHIPLNAVFFPSVNCISLYYFLPIKLPLTRFFCSTHQLPQSPAAICSLASFGHFISTLFLLCLPDAKQAGQIGNSLQQPIQQVPRAQQTIVCNITAFAHNLSA